ncbi:MAG TPA: hypothetical protein VGO62_17655, partial [Myxococcota bacterium]
VDDDGGVRALVGDQASHEIAITSDGARVLYFAADHGHRGNVAVVPFSGPPSAAQILAAGASDVRLVLSDDDARVFFVDASDGLSSIALDGGAARSLAAGAVDVVAARGALVVYASFADAQTGLRSLSIVGTDGTNDVSLGVNALDVGFTGDGRCYTFLDDVTFDGKGHAHGRLRAFDSATNAVQTLGSDVRKAQVGGARFLAYVDNTQHLSAGALGQTIAPVQISVDTFDILGRDTAAPHLVYSIRAEENAGVWLVDP